MRLGLLGHPIAHSLSPKIYEHILGSGFTYDLLDFSSVNDIPALTDLAKNYDGLNITSPYKDLFIKQVEFEIEAFAELGVINTLSFVDGQAIATNTDYAAVEIILERYLKLFPHLKILLLGSGAMAKITEIIASSLEIPFVELSRRLGFDLNAIDLRKYQDQNRQILVINATSRKFIFNGLLSSEFLFWDYNYSYLTNPTHISSQVKDYQDGQEMLKLQAEAAVEFWKRTNPKLK